MCNPHLLHLTEPRTCAHCVTRFGQRFELPEFVVVDRVGSCTALDEQTVHLLEVVLQTVVATREDTRRKCCLEHVSLELHGVANLQTACAIEHLNVGSIANNFDDLGHQLNIAQIYVADFVLRNGAVGLHHHKVRDDT